MFVANRSFSLVCSVLVVALGACSEVHEKPFDPDSGGERDAAIFSDGAVVDAATVGDASVLIDASVVDAVVSPDAALDAKVDARVLIDVCDNPDDLAGLTELGGRFNQILQEQGIPCFIASMGGPGFAMCIADALGDYLSGDCALCVGQQANCLVSNCLDRCVTDQGGQVCLDCVCDAGCVENFATCSGVDFGLFECPAP